MSDRPYSRSEIKSPRGRILLHRRFRNFDELSESVKGWDLDWRQLDKGPLDAEILQVGEGAAQLDRDTFGRQFE